MRKNKPQGTSFWSPPLLGWQYWLELASDDAVSITYSYESDGLEVLVEDYYGDLRNIAVYVSIHNGENSMHDFQFHKIGGSIKEIFQYIESAINIKVVESRKIVTALGIE